MSTAERRARLATRHMLAPGARGDDVVDIARALVVLHATDPSTVFLAVAARSVEAAPADVERALYDERTLMRMLGMRRTMFVVPDELAPIVKASSTDAIAARERRKLVAWLVAAGVDEGGKVDVEAWLDAVCDSTHRLLRDRGDLTAAALTRAEGRLQTRIDTSPGKPYSRPGNITSWVLALLAAEGRAVRGATAWVVDEQPVRLVTDRALAPEGHGGGLRAAARAELAERWLRAFGPARVEDLKWWTGWSLGEVRRTLDDLDVAEVEVDGTAAIVLADDLAPVGAPEPWAALLPALDPTPMGWVERAWFLGDLGPQLFDRTGNIGPTVWWDGRVVGTWAQRKDGEIVTRVLSDDSRASGRDATNAIGREAQRLKAWLGDVRVTPRFHTAAERQLAAG